MFELLSTQFRSCLDQYGRVLAGDEKLLRFTGNSAYIRQVKSKPDRIGLWFFECCAVLGTGKPFLLYARLSDANSEVGKKVPVDSVVDQWEDFALENKPKSTIILLYLCSTPAT